MIATTPGTTVRLAVVQPHGVARTFSWVLGHTGDVSHPLEGSGGEIELAPAAGTTFVWVQSITPCLTSTAEFTINAVPSRRRATR